MKIKRVYIKSFGSLNEYSLEFTDGVNLIRKENECGKTTVAEFNRPRPARQLIRVLLCENKR